MINGIEDTCTLNNGVQMPCLGLGVYKANAGEEVYNAVRYALDAGYRLIDTAAFYFNEEGVGKAVEDSSVPRDEIFITTKLWPLNFSDVDAAFEKSLRQLNCGYIDMYLMHWPGVDADLRLRAWDRMMELSQKGKIRACGVSNFYVNHLEHMIQHTGCTPANDQIELHPWHQQKDIKDYCDSHDISVTAWGPIFHGHLSEEPLVETLGQKYGKTAAQVTLRWHLQHGVNIIPKSVSKNRIVENAELFDFELTEEDMEKIDALDGKGTFAWDANTFDGHIKE